MRKGGDWIEDYLKYTEETEPPILYKEWTAASTIAAALQRKCWLPWGIDDTIFPNLYVVLVGPPGATRKGTAMKTGIKLLREIGINLAPKSVTREALIKVIEDNNAETALQSKEVIHHCSLSIFSPELTVFLGHDDGPFLAALTDWYDCDDVWEYLTKNQGVNNILNIWVNLMGATTPSLIQRALPLNTIGGGLASRIIFVFEDEIGKIVPAPFETPSEIALRSSLVIDLGSIHSIKGKFSFTKDCMDLWIDWYTNMHKNMPKMPPTFDGYLSRRQTHVRKLAMIMSASRGNDTTITVEDFNRGLDMLKRTEVKMPRTFLGFGGAKNSPLLMALLAYIAKKKKVLSSDIYSDFHGYIESVRHLKEVLEVLRAQNAIKIEKIGDKVWIIYLTGHKLFDMFKRK